MIVSDFEFHHPAGLKISRRLSLVQIAESRRVCGELKRCQHIQTLDFRKLSEIAMRSVFEKLNLKERREIVVLNAPASFRGELQALNGVTVLLDLAMAKVVHFALVFATQQAEVDSLSNLLAAKAQGDALLWFAYPKGTSKKYTCDFNRDTGWSVMRGAGFDTVRAVAIDEDWSALRFRRVEFIKSAASKSAASST